MGIGKYTRAIITLTKSNLEDFILKCAYRRTPKDFTRERKMGFKETVLFMLNTTRKSLQIEINSFYEKIIKKDYNVSKQAFIEARQKIKPELFIYLADEVNKLLYQECDDGYEKWNGYRLSAIDGSVLEIPDTEDLRNEFGFQKNQNGKIARARSACIFDVVNKIVIKSVIGRYDSSERAMAMQMIKQMLDEKKEKELILFDRGYPSAELMGFLIDNGIDFVMRAQRNFSNDVMNAKKEDQFISVKHKEKTYKIRVLRFTLDSEQEEILLTSLCDKTLEIKVFKELYFKRWGIEIKFDELKNRLEIENFSGTSRIAIEQDFYASIYISNVIAVSRAHNDEKIRKRNKGIVQKYEQKTNMNILVGTFREKFVLMVLEDSPRKRDKMLKTIMKNISRSTIPIRPGRQNERVERISRNKYKTNAKRSL